MLRSDAAEALFAEASAAAKRGDTAQAVALLQRVLSLLESPEDAQPRSVALSTLARLLLREGEFDRAIAHFEQVLPLVDVIGDVRGRSLTLDNLAAAYAGKRSWRDALSFWEQALELDTQLGNERDRAAALANVALASAQLGDRKRASEAWREAADLLAKHGVMPGLRGILEAMGAMGQQTGDYGDPLGVRARVLAAVEGKEPRVEALALDGLGHAALGGDKPALALGYWQRAHGLIDGIAEPRWSAVVLANIGSCHSALGDEPRAIEAWERAVIALREQGDGANSRRVAELLGKARGRSSKLTFGSVSEYAVTPASAPFFLVGELWAALQQRGVELRSQRFEDFTVGPSGIAGVTLRTILPPTIRVEPEDAAADLLEALARRPPEVASALLAGYTRLGYELIDRDTPGFTSAVLDRLEVPHPRPEPAPEPFDVPALLRDLAVELRLVAGCPTLVPTRDRGVRNIWKEAPRDAFQLIVALLVVGVDCRQLFARDKAWHRFGAHSPLYRLLWPEPLPDADSPATVERVRALAPGLELAVGLAQVLRRQRLEEPFDFNHVLFWVRRILVAEADEQATLLGDILIHTALRCAALVAKEGADPRTAEPYVQKAIILLEYTSRGLATDERRLVTLTRGLYGVAWYPKPLEPRVFPAEVSRQAVAELGSWNSLLLTYRELAQKSLAKREQGQPGLLRSAALRGLRAARHVLRLSYACAASREPEAAIPGLALLRLTVKNHAHLVSCLGSSAAHELRTTGHSSWMSFFEQGPNPARLAREMGWIQAFYDAAAQEGFSLDVARPFMRQGAEFVVDVSPVEVVQAPSSRGSA